MRAECGRNVEFKHAAAGVALARHLRVIAAARRLEIQTLELSARLLRRRGRAHNIEVKPEAVDHVRVFERQTVDEAARAFRQRFRVTDQYLPGALCRYRVDAEFEVIALRDLQQPRIDLPAGDVFEHGLAARFVDRHRFAQAAVHVERETEHVLAIEQRELQVAFEYPAIRIVKRQRYLGDRKTAADLGIHGNLLQPHGCFARRCDYQLRPRPALDWRRRQILRACRRSEPCACRQQQ